MSEIIGWTIYGIFVMILGSAAVLKFRHDRANRRKRLQKLLFDRCFDDFVNEFIDEATKHPEKYYRTPPAGQIYPGNMLDTLKDRKNNVPAHLVNSKTSTN